MNDFPGGVGVAILVFFAKFKEALIGLIKLVPVILKSGGRMLLSIGGYAMAWGFGSQHSAEWERDIQETRDFYSRLLSELQILP